MSSYQRALAPPAGELVSITRALVDEAVAYSRTSPRRRVILPLHKHEADPLHRMINAMQPDSYVQPHRHLDPPKSEAWIALRGALVLFTFEDDGRVKECVLVEAGGERFGVDLVPGVYHTALALEPDTVVYEVKTGPYQQANDKAFAPWAPEEGTSEAAAYVRGLLEQHVVGRHG